MGVIFVLLLIAGGILAFMLMNNKDEEASDPKDDTTTSAPAPAPNPKAPSRTRGQTSRIPPRARIPAAATLPRIKWEILESTKTSRN